MDKRFYPLFNKQVVEEELSSNNIDNIYGKMEIVKQWIENDNIKSMSETQLKPEFFKNIFENVLGYVSAISGKLEWTLCIEQKTEVDGKRPDGILGFYSNLSDSQNTQAVIEVKGFGANLDEKQRRLGKDYTAVEQAFSYVSKYDGCKWVIVSNFQEIRLYKLGRSENYCERFFISELMNKNEFKRFYTILCKDNLISKDGNPHSEELSNKVYKQEISITKEFYQYYRQIRVELISIIRGNNNNICVDEAIRCAQKFLDRIIFICFCESIDLIKNGTLREIINSTKNLYNKYIIWNSIKDLFFVLDRGYSERKINKFNGELFKPDYTLDNLLIPNDFFNSLEVILKYRFSTDLNVDILGHIFEQSITDIENLRKEFGQTPNDSNSAIRQGGAIYYTPEKITRYIIENTLGEYLKEKFQEARLKATIIKSKTNTVNYQGRKLSKEEIKELETYKIYRNLLHNIKILDPACGSGAFLVKAFDYLQDEYLRVEKVIRELAPIIEGQTDMFELNKHILNNNIYGVDLNFESVEITKLSLWIKTAEKDKPLNALDHNIRCGNSIISDSSITEKAFSWELNFPEVFKQGGFDIIVGNPPYIEWYKINPRKQLENGEYIGVEYDFRPNHNDSQPNLYMFFLILSKSLLRGKGRLGMITSQEWLNHDRVEKIKSSLISNSSIKNVIFDSRYGVFIDPDGTRIGTNSSIIFLTKENPQKSISINIPLGKEDELLYSYECLSLPYCIEVNGKWNFRGIDESYKKIISKIETLESIHLSDREHFEVFGGFQPPVEKIKNFGLTQKEYENLSAKEREIVFKAIYDARSIKRYYIEDTGNYWIVANKIESESELKLNYPYIYEILYNRISNRNNIRWFDFPNIRNIEKFSTYQNKLLSPRTSKCNSFAIDNDKYVFKGTNTAIVVKKGFDINYVAGILNSSLYTYWYHIKGKDYHGLISKYEPKPVKEKFAIPIVNEQVQNYISEKVNNLNLSRSQLYEKISELKIWIKIAHNIDISDNFYSNSFDDFYIMEISKSSNIIEPKVLQSIRIQFEKYTNKCLMLIRKMELLDIEIDECVYKIFSVTKDEKSIIKEYINQIKNSEVSECTIRAI